MKNDIKKAIGHLTHEDVIFFCVGTDRSTGDSLGPLVGTYLTKLGYNVVGTIRNPCHADNLQVNIDKLPKGKTIIAIDACLGRMTSVGDVRFKNGSLNPGAGVDKELPPVGDYHIVGFVNIGGFMEYFVLQNTRLSLIMDMADQIVNAITETFPLYALEQIAVAKEEARI